MKRLQLFLFLSASALLLTRCIHEARADKVLEFNFAVTNADVAVTDGQSTNPAMADFFPANIKDDTGNFGPGQNFGSPWGTYRIDGSVPDVPTTLPPGWDGKTVFFPGTGSANIIRFDDMEGAFISSFSAYARFNRKGLANDIQVFDWIIGGAQPNNFGWGIYLSHPTAPPAADSIPTLDVNLGGDFETTGTSRGVYDGSGPQILNDRWYDVGIIYDGTPFDGTDDTLKVFLDGELINTFTGDADFDPMPFGFTFAIGGDSFANEGFNGYYDRVMLWNNAITEAEMLALMPTPDMGIVGDANGDGFVDIFDVNVISSQWGTAGPEGDVNDDNVVDIFDVNVVSANWAPPPPPGGGSAVPEPAGLALGLVAATAMMGLVRTRRRPSVDDRAS